jgi:hypothetical protein
MSTLVEIDRFLRRSGMSPTRFGLLAIKDRSLVHDLRRGRKLRPDTEERIAAFMKERH